MQHCRTIILPIHGKITYKKHNILHSRKMRSMRNQRSHIMHQPMSLTCRSNRNTDYPCPEKHDSKQEKLNLKPYLFIKFEQSKIIHNYCRQTYIQTGLMPCLKNRLKPYRSTKNLTIRYGFNHYKKCMFNGNSK